MTAPEPGGRSASGAAGGALAGKVVLVAGASSGIGRATAVAAAAAGARVALFARSADRLADLARDIEAGGGSALALPGDATDEADATRAATQAVERWGRLDAAVNSVGVNIKERALTTLTPAGWRTLISQNLDAAYVLTQAVLPAFRRQHDGLLIHISSVSAKRADASGVAYQASKAGVAALGHGTMAEERESGVRVSVVFAGLTDTPLVEQRPTPPTPAELARALQPEDIAGLCVAVLALPARAHVSEIVVAPSIP